MRFEAPKNYYLSTRRRYIIVAAPRPREAPFLIPRHIISSNGRKFIDERREKVLHIVWTGQISVGADTD